MYKDLTIAIATYNSEQIIANCLNSLKGAHELGAEILVIDNNSTDKTSEIIKNEFGFVRYINTGGNYGFGYSFNKGVELSGTKYAAVLNADIEVNANTFLPLINVLSKEKNACVAAPATYTLGGELEGNIRKFPTLSTQFCESFLGGKLSKKLNKSETISDEANYKHTHKVEWIKGAIWCVNKEIFTSLKGMRTDFFLYSEETEFAWRCRDNGYEIFIVPEAKATHIGGESDTHPLLFTLLCFNKLVLMRIRKKYINFQLFRLFLIASFVLRINKSYSRESLKHICLSFFNFENRRKKIIEKLNGTI